MAAYPYFDLAFQLYTDASSQVQDGKERMSTSRSANSSNKNYGATKLECLAMVWAIRKFPHYLVGNTFKIYTDYYFLQWLRTMKAIDCTLLNRWC